MVLFTNLRDVKIEERNYRPVPILRLTTGSEIALESLPEKDKELLEKLKKKSTTNGFRISLNDKYLN